MAARIRVRFRLQLGCIAQSRHPEQSLAMFWLGRG